MRIGHEIGLRSTPRISSSFGANRCRDPPSPLAGSVYNPESHMKPSCKVIAAALALFASSLLFAAEPIKRVMVVTDVETDDPTGYAAWIAKSNEAAKAKFGAETYLRVYQSVMDGTRTGSVRVVAIGDSVATLTKITAGLEADPAMNEVRDHFRAIRKLGGRTLYQCVRFDGSHPKNSVYTTIANLADEAAYLTALNQLRSIFDQGGFKDAKINVYRVVAGRTNHTHRISIGLPSGERLAAFLDFVATDAKGAEWIASQAKNRTVVANMTAQEITK